MKHMALGFLVFGFMIVLNNADASAATKVWDGGGGADTNFSNPLNWADDTIPSNSDDLEFPAPTSSSYTATRNIVSDIGKITVLPGPTNNFNVNIVTVGTFFVLGSNSGGIEVADHQSLIISGSASDKLRFTGSVSTPIKGGIDSDITFSLPVDYSAGPLDFNSTTAISSISELPKITFANKLQRDQAGRLLTANLDSVHVELAEGNASLDVNTINVNNAILEASNVSAFGPGSGDINLHNSQLRLSGGSQFFIDKFVKIDGNLFGRTTNLAGYEAITTSGVAANFTGGVVLESDVVFNPNLGTITISGYLLGNFLISVSEPMPINRYLIINAISNTSKLPNGKYGVVVANAVYDDSQSDVDLYVREGNAVIVNGERRNVTLEKNATLKGRGKLADVTMKDGSHIAPGNSPGCLNTGDTVFAASSSFDIEIGGNIVCSEYDQLKVTGTVNLNNAGLNVNLLSNFKPNKGDQFIILDNDNTDAITGIFRDLPEGSHMTAAGVTFKISYTGGDGNDIILTVESIEESGSSAPGAPNTGMRLLSTKPLLTLAVTTVSAGVLFMLAYRYSFAGKK